MIRKYVVFFLHCNDRHLPKSNAIDYFAIMNLNKMSAIRVLFSFFTMNPGKYFTFTNQIVERNLSDGWYHLPPNIAYARTFSPASCICTQNNKKCRYQTSSGTQKNHITKKGDGSAHRQHNEKKKKMKFMHSFNCLFYSLRNIMHFPSSSPVRACVFVLQANDKRPKEKKRREI